MSDKSPYKIESGIQIKDIHTHVAKPLTFPWMQMKVGDSFLVEHDDAFELIRLRSKLAAELRKAKRQIPGLSICTRSVHGGFRVWRMS